MPRGPWLALQAACATALTLIYFALGLTPSCSAFGRCCTLLLSCCRQTHGDHACAAAVGVQQSAGKQQQSTSGGMQAHSSKQVRWHVLAYVGAWVHMLCSGHVGWCGHATQLSCVHEVGWEG